MGPSFTAIWMLILFVLLLGADLQVAPRQTCPGCTRKNGAPHAKGCHWEDRD